MMDEQFKPIPEYSLSSGEAEELAERVQRYRGDLLGGLDSLKAGKGKYVVVLVNVFADGPVDIMATTARRIAEVYGEYISDGRGDPKGKWTRYGVLEVDNFGEKEVRQAIEQFAKDNAGINGGVDAKRVGAIDLATSDTNKLKFGAIDLKEGKMTSAIVDRGMI